MKSALLERLSKEKPAHKKDEIDEALRRGYSVKQIVQALTPEMKDTEIRQGKILKLIAAIRGFVFRHSPLFYERKRLKLSMRLHWIFDRDFIEGTCDCAVRACLARN